MRKRALRSDSGKCRVPVESRFWAKVDRKGPQDCWPWLSWGNVGGYGRFKLSGKNYLSTHIALMLDGRPRPFPKAVAMHSCDNPVCNNPAHLSWGAVADNNADRDAKGRAVYLCGENRPNAVLSEDLVAMIRRSPLSVGKLSESLGISECAIRSARHGQTWAGVTSVKATPKPGAPRGEKAATAKLTEDEARSILLSDEPSHVLSSLYGVTASNIDRIRRGEQWAHLGIAAKRTGLLKGEKIWQAKLDAQTVRDLRASPLNHAEAAKAFNISASVICRVRARKAWAHID